jgi:hypothetical protein
MMINTRSAAAFSITRLRAIQSGKQKSLAKPTFQKENQRICPARFLKAVSATNLPLYRNPPPAPL